MCADVLLPQDSVLYNSFQDQRTSCTIRQKEVHFLTLPSPINKTNEPEYAQVFCYVDGADAEYFREFADTICMRKKEHENLHARFVPQYSCLFCLPTELFECMHKTGIVVEPRHMEKIPPPSISVKIASHLRRSVVLFYPLRRPDRRFSLSCSSCLTSFSMTRSTADRIVNACSPASNVSRRQYTQPSTR